MRFTSRGDYEDENVGRSLEGLAWVLAVLSILIVSARFYVRSFLIHRLKWDDWTMLLALILGVKNTIFIQISVHYGLGRHMRTLDPVDAMNAIKWDYLAQPSAIMSPAIGRISFALLLLSVFTHERLQRTWLYAIIVSQFIVNSVTFILILVQCQPVEMLWNKDPNLKGSCWDLRIQEYTGYFQGSFNSATDLYLAVAPAVTVWNLNMKLAMKISLICLMGLGIFAMAASIVKTVLLKSVGSNDDYTYNTSFLVIWWTVELYLVIIAASIPTLKPLIKRVIENTQSSQGGQGDSYGLKSFRSRQAHPYIPTTDTITKASTNTRRQSTDDESSQINILRPADEYSAKDIRKTVGVSVEYTHR